MNSCRHDTDDHEPRWVYTLGIVAAIGFVFGVLAAVVQ